MRWLASLVVVLLLLSSAAPVFACTTGQPTASGHAVCCTQAHIDCNRTADASCCLTGYAPDRTAQLAVPTHRSGVHWAVVGRVTPAASATQPPISTLVQRTVARPPGLPNAQLSILRI